MVPPLCHRALGHLCHRLIIAAPPFLGFRIPDMRHCTDGRKGCCGSDLRHMFLQVSEL